jgi:hypothetical protein
MLALFDMMNDIQMIYRNMRYEIHFRILEESNCQPALASCGKGLESRRKDYRDLYIT